jgi:hypothetical protein
VSKVARQFCSVYRTVVNCQNNFLIYEYRFLNLVHKHAPDYLTIVPNKVNTKMQRALWTCIIYRCTTVHCSTDPASILTFPSYTCLSCNRGPAHLLPVALVQNLPRLVQSGIGLEMLHQLAPRRGQTGSQDSQDHRVERCAPKHPLVAPHYLQTSRRSINRARFHLTCSGSSATSILVKLEKSSTRFLTVKTQSLLGRTVLNLNQTSLYKSWRYLGTVSARMVRANCVNVSAKGHTSIASCLRSFCMSLAHLEGLVSMSSKASTTISSLMWTGLYSVLMDMSSSQSSTRVKWGKWVARSFRRGPKRPEYELWSFWAWCKRYLIGSSDMNSGL